MAGLGIGHSEKVYQKGIISVLNSRKIFHRSEVTTPIYFMGEVVGIGRADIVLGNLAIELKAVSNTPPRASGQLAKYVNSLNDDRVNAFNRRRVVSPFFNNDWDGVLIHEDEYESAENEMNASLFMGVLVNFNQKNGLIDMVTTVSSNVVECPPKQDPVKMVRKRTERPSGPGGRQGCPVLSFISEYTDHPHCVTKTAATWYDVFRSSNVGKYNRITGAIFSRTMSCHAMIDGSGITKSRAACSGSKYTIDPIVLKEYLSTAQVGSGEY